MEIPHYRIEIELETAILTPMHSGTLFGQICWAYRALRGEQALEGWLRSMPEEPFLVSGGMPRGYLPRPMLTPMRRSGRLSLGELDAAKTLRRTPWVSRKDFEALRDGISEGQMLRRLKLSEANGPQAMKRSRRAHNTINRLTGTSLDEGGLYFVDEEWPDSRLGSGKIDVYAASWLNEVSVRELFEFVGQWGFGRDASTGKGRWSCSVHSERNGLFGEGGARRMSLSHGSLTANMLEARYKLEVHVGKVGGGYGMSSDPFKYPITLLRPGATFRPATGEASRWGELLREVHPEKHWIVHQAEHLTVGYTEECNG